MNQSLVITAIGEDRPGIVDELTEALLNTHLNIEDSRMSVLGGEFVVMLLVTGSAASINTIEQNKEALSDSLNLHLLIKTTSSPADVEADVEGCQRYKITVEGMDNPGIVHKLARYLSHKHINIVNMQTRSQHAAHTGTPIFSVNMQVDIPSSQNISTVQTEFSDICDALSMDAEFTPVY